jgi:hypothetical protein
MGLDRLLGGFVVNFGLPALSGVVPDPTTDGTESGCTGVSGCAGNVCGETTACGCTDACTQNVCSIGGCTFLSGSGDGAFACLDAPCTRLSGA